MPGLREFQEFGEFIRNKDSFNYAYEIVKPYGVIEEVLDWAKNQLAGEWRWQLVDLSNHARPGRYIFYFDQERDYFAFVLKWS